MNRAAMTRLAGLELGGTNTIVVLGDGTQIADRIRFETRDAGSTLERVREQLDIWNEEAPIEALGIASFGPVEVRPQAKFYGQVLSTPKPGWSGADLVGALASAIDGPIAIHTDVTAAALAEGRWGAARDCADHVYVTVGTGIGVGIIVRGEPVVGQLHPEAGHMRVPRSQGDGFAGTCPFHGDCLEGLAAGPAIEGRSGMAGKEVSDDHPLWPCVIDPLAEAAANLFLTLASERIVFGGGVINARPWLVDAIAGRCAAKLDGYLPYIEDRAPIFAAELKDDAGPRGALLLAEEALGRGG